MEPQNPGKTDDRLDKTTLLLLVLYWLLLGLAVVAWKAEIYVVPYVLFALGIKCRLKLQEHLGLNRGTPVPLNPAFLPDLVQTARRDRFRTLAVFCADLAAAAALFVFLGWNRWTEFATATTCLLGWLLASKTRIIKKLCQWQANPAIPLSVRPVGTPRKTIFGECADIRVSPPGDPSVPLFLFRNPSLYRRLFP